MPICPKCGKLISAKKFARHVNRCGEHHKKPVQPIDHPDNFFGKI